MKKQSLRENENFASAVLPEKDRYKKTTGKAHGLRLYSKVQHGGEFAPGSDNKRGFPRFSLQKELYVIHRDFGKIVEISMDGLLFIYLDGILPDTEIPSTGILFNYSDQYLDKIPFEIVADNIAQHMGKTGHRLRQRRIKFGVMSDEQIAEIEKLILANARIPQLSSDTRYTTWKDVYTKVLRNQ